MAEKLITPIDELTGLPWSIIPSKNIHNLHGTENVNRNHAFHPKLDPRLLTVGGLALRVCRIQEVEATQHNYGKSCYHTFYDGPPIQEDETEQFKTVIWALAGYIPEFGIELSGGEPKERLITKKEMASLKTLSKEDYKYIHHGDSPIRVFLRKIILDKTVYVDIKKLDDFISSKNVDKRRKLGMEVLRQASQIASLDINSEYKKEYSRGSLRSNVPKTPDVYVTDVIRNEERVEETMFNPLSVIAERVLEKV